MYGDRITARSSDDYGDQIQWCIAGCSADAIVIATGSSWPNLPQFPIDGQQLLTSRHLLDLDCIPASLLIVGAGVKDAVSGAL